MALGFGSVEVSGGLAKISLLEGEEGGKKEEKTTMASIDNYLEEF